MHKNLYSGTAQPFGKIAVLLNAKAGRAQSFVIAKEITQRLDALNITYDLFDEHWPETLYNYSDCWIIGGDGTVNFTLNKYKDNFKPFVVFKGGTGNDFAWKLYGNASTRQIIDIALSNNPKWVDAGICNGKIYLNSAGFGFDGEVLRSMKSIRFIGGHIGYLGVVLKKIFSYKEPRFKLLYDGQIVEQPFLLLIVNNSSRTGGGFMVTPSASLTDGKLDMVLCEPLGIFSRLRYLPRIEKGTHLQLPFITYRLVNDVEIHCDKLIYAQLDGELISDYSFQLKVLPGAVSFRY